MFRTIILSIAAVLSLNASASACEFDIDTTKAFRVINIHNSLVMSDISFDPELEWIDGHPYISMVELEEDGFPGVELYYYHDIILEPINPENIILN